MPRRRKYEQLLGLATIGLGIRTYRISIIKNKEVEVSNTKNPNPDRKRNEKLHHQKDSLKSEPDLKKKIGRLSSKLQNGLKKSQLLIIFMMVQLMVMYYCQNYSGQRWRLATSRRINNRLLFINSPYARESPAATGRS
ncbi:MAG: hypothetical protein IPL26_16180 [Leptospiraceae bacterium]|nr:hypothetical protein [Leptospiraceae bacterium]